MGNTESKQKLGERVIAARSKLEHDTQLQCEKYEYLKSKSPKTMNVIMDSIAASFKECAPFLEATLLIAWKYDEDRCKQIVIDSCKTVFRAPIIKTEYEWFKQYVFTSSIWMFKNKENCFMYEELMSIAADMSFSIKDSMDGIYKHLQTHPKWNDILKIQNETIINRQDHKTVGLLQQDGIRDIVESKDETNASDDIKGFIDSNLAINILTTTAKTINNEFQNHMKRIMSHYGDVKSGPIKKVERCLSKLENDYYDAAYPKASRLLDLVRCSVTFNTVDQLLAGYEGLTKYMKNNQSMMELARIKNMYLDVEYDGGYRDIKVCIVYHSSINIGMSMICEVQLMLGQYLHEKKRIHKLYSIQREKMYFDMVVTEYYDEKQEKDIKDLKILPILNVTKDIEKLKYTQQQINKSSVDAETDLLGMEGRKWFGVVDMHSKEVIFEEKCAFEANYPREYGTHCHHWISINNEKYLSVQTDLNVLKRFKIKNKQFEEDRSGRIILGSKDMINFVEFDRNFQNILMVVNYNVLQIRSVNNIQKCKVKIKLENEMSRNTMKQMALSNNGEFCVLGGGVKKNYSYLIDLEKHTQYKLISSLLTSTLAPCFINGESQYVAIGDGDGRGNIEIWDVQKRQIFKTIKPFSDQINCMYSTNNILAIGSNERMVKLYDVRDWEMFHSQKYEMYPVSIHLTSDSKYLTVSGWYGEQCIVSKIQ
eukprot:189285_1